MDIQYLKLIPTILRCQHPHQYLCPNHGTLKNQVEEGFLVADLYTAVSPGKYKTLTSHVATAA